MGKTVNNTLTGIFAAILIGGLIIYSIEDDRSFLQILTGFAICIVPFTFLSSFFSKVASFILVLSFILLGYLTFKMEYYDVWIGIVMAAIIGGATFYFRINQYKPFSAKDYKKEAEEIHQNKNRDKND
jgi:hypothetical protein